MVDFHTGLNVGCVPSKALIRCARAARDRANPEFGVTGKSTIDFGEVLKRVRRLRARIAPADAHTATTQAGADVYQGFGKFTSPNTIEVNGQTLRFSVGAAPLSSLHTTPSSPGAFVSILVHMLRQTRPEPVPTGSAPRAPRVCAPS